MPLTVNISHHRNMVV